MKKILKNRIFIVLITMIICISGTLYATTKYNANEILYNETTVEDALNELYKFKKSESTGYEMLQDWTKISVTNHEASNTIYTAPDNYYEYKEIIIFFSNNQTGRQVYDGIATNCIASVNQAESLMGAVITLTDFTGIPTYQFQMLGSNGPYIIVYGIK